MIEMSNDRCAGVPGNEEPREASVDSSRSRRWDCSQSCGTWSSRLYARYSEAPWRSRHAEDQTEPYRLKGHVNRGFTIPRAKSLSSTSGCAVGPI